MPGLPGKPKKEISSSILLNSRRIPDFCQLQTLGRGQASHRGRQPPFYGKLKRLERLFALPDLYLY
jgi:hypothetical protein